MTANLLLQKQVPPLFPPDLCFMKLQVTYTVWFVRLALVALWVPVAVDKLWDLQEFHSTLLRQPFPTWYAETREAKIEKILSAYFRLERN